MKNQVNDNGLPKGIYSGSHLNHTNIPFIIILGMRTRIFCLALASQQSD